MSSKKPKEQSNGEARFVEKVVGTVDLNCDMGEGIGNDEQIMPFISSANIACGYHGGDKETIRETIELAIKYNVAIGAHVSFPDRENFGRTEMNLPAGEIRDLVTRQLIILKDIADSFGIKMKHVKPHGALYNMSAKDQVLAATIAEAVKAFDENLILFGLSGSPSIHEAKAVGLQTASEVFADRTYLDDGSLTARSKPNALIENIDKAIQQVLEMMTNGKVTTVTGKKVPVIAETICIHGDAKNAVQFARNIYRQLNQNNIVIKAV